jgi:hypothetical protein
MPLAIMFARRFELRTLLSLEECLARLGDAIDSPSFFGASRSVVGRAGSASRRISKRLRYGSNAFQSHLTARLQPAPGETILVGKVGLHPIVITVMSLWFGGLILMSGALIAADVNSPAWLSPLLMVALGMGVVAFGRYLARGDSQFLLDFLCQTLDARDVAQKPDRTHHEKTP